MDRGKLGFKRWLKREEKGMDLDEDGLGEVGDAEGVYELRERIGGVMGVGRGVKWYGEQLILSGGRE